MNFIMYYCFIVSSVFAINIMRLKSWDIRLIAVYLVMSIAHLIIGYLLCKIKVVSTKEMYINDAIRAIMSKNKKEKEN